MFYILKIIADCRYLLHTSSCNLLSDKSSTSRCILWALILLANRVIDTITIVKNVFFHALLHCFETFNFLQANAFLALKNFQSCWISAPFIFEVFIVSVIAFILFSSLCINSFLLKRADGVRRLHY